MRKIILIATSLLTPVLAQATLTLADYHTAGDQLIIHDSVTNKDWLKLSQTLGMSPNQALNANSGFYLATPTDVTNLFTDAGGFTALDGTIRNTSPDLQTGTLLYNLFGPTTQFNFGPGQYDAQTWAHVSRPGSAPPVYDMYMLDLRHGIGFPGASAQFSQLGNCYDCSSSIEANFMVRTAVNTPEPASALLIGAGLLAVAALSKRIREKSRRRQAYRRVASLIS